MASSSQVSRTKYDVFISFRGTDVRSGILSHLKRELQQKHIDVYADDRLERGDEISSALVRAIEESAMSLIIFSKDYASSKWCLEELVKIMECMNRFQQIVIPVFYSTDPSDVRHQKGSYGDAFAQHDKNYKEKVAIWRSALNTAANLSGFHSANYRDEAELVEQVAKSLSTRLNMLNQCELRNLVGIEKKVAELETLMQQGSEDVRLIGIWGMGGIGKTTIATILYHRFCYEYEGYYFQADVREESEKHGILHLKKQIYEMVLNEKDSKICTPIGLPSHIKRKLRQTKILLVLDDINDSDQLESLVGEPDFLGPGSRIIITARDKEVLNEKVNKIYEVKPLMADEALELLNLNAFKENCQDPEWIELSKRVIKYAQELPLALKILGSFLRGKKKEDWESQMKKLEGMPFRKIHDVLRLSYDSLDRQQKTIFLYIACCFKGYKQCDILALLDSCGFSTSVELTVLRDKALITWSSEMPIISMHDLIKEMGKEIVREESIEDPGKRSLLWDPGDIYKVLQNNTGTATIQSIILDKLKSGEILSLNPQAFARMHKLKFLKLPHDHLSLPKIQYVDLRDGLGYLPDELRLLYWHGYPLKSLPMTFCAKNLVELDLRFSNVEKLWDEVKPLGNLRKINLRWSGLVELPDLSLAKNLEEVDLKGCGHLCLVHPSIFSLPKLEKFDLSFCHNLTSLGSINVHSKSLRELFLDGCTGLKEFSVTSENMIKLSLRMMPFKELPIGCLRKLEYLNLVDCASLTHLPSNFVELTSLRCLSIGDCIKLASLPQLPPSIEQLWAERCRSLEIVQFTSEDGVPLNRNIVFIRLQSCMKLDEHSCKAVELTARLNLRKYAFKTPEEQCKILTPRDNVGPKVTYPGSEVPKWFKYRGSRFTIGSKLTITPHSKLLGFIFCMILGIGERFLVHIFLANNDDEILPSDDRFVYTCGSHDFEHIGTEHVCICYAACSGMINERIEERRGSYHNITYNPKLSFLFLTSTGKCGVNPIYANEEEKEEDKDSIVDEEDIDDDSEKNEEDHEDFEEDIDDYEEDEIEAFPPTKRLK